jgi:quinol-cytochrome oxidoreductase complex cytochrome b subunit
MFQTLKLIPAKILGFDGEVIGIMAFNIVAMLLFIVPFVDRSDNRRRRMIFNILGVLALLYIVVLTIVGYMT